MDEAWTHLASSGGSNSQTSPEKTRTPGSTASLAGQAGSSLARTVKLITASLTAVIFINMVNDDVDDDSNQWLLHWKGQSDAGCLQAISHSRASGSKPTHYSIESTFGVTFVNDWSIYQWQGGSCWLAFRHCHKFPSAFGECGFPGPKRLFLYVCAKVDHYGEVVNANVRKW